MPCKTSNKYQSPETCSCSFSLLFFFSTLSTNLILLISTGNWHALEQIRMHVLPRWAKGGGIRWTWVGQVARCTSSFREQLHISLDTVRRCLNWFRPTSGCVSQCSGTSAKSWIFRACSLSFKCCWKCQLWCQGANGSTEASAVLALWAGWILGMPKM